MYKEKRPIQVLRHDMCCNKLIKIMKLSFLCLLIGCLSISAATHSQEAKVSLKIKNKSISHVFDEIQRQTSYSFWFESEDVNVKKKVSVDVEKETVASVLESVLHNQNVDFSLKGNHIVIVSKDAKSKDLASASTTKEIVAIPKRKISGTIVDELGVPVIGASVLIKGTANGVTSDLDGNFTLEVDTKDILVVSFIGYSSQEIVVNKQESLSITLKENLKALDEVVVVGFGVQKKINLTGAVASIGKESLESRPLTSLSAGLQGLVPGMTVMQSSGQPGRDSGTIKIRGEGTLGNGSPMILVDGIESSMENVDANDVESISVLKDASSAAIYGSKAANGVILITTKRGSLSGGKPKISYNNNFGWQKETDRPERLSSWEYAELYNEGLVWDGKKPRWTEEDIAKFRAGTDPYLYPNTDWRDLLYTGSGFQHQHNVNIVGGSDMVRYMASVGYQEQNGILPNTSKKQYNARTNLDITPIKNLEVGLSMYFSNRDIVAPTNPYAGGPHQYFVMANRMAPWIPVRDANGDYGYISDGNPIAWLDFGATIDKVERRVNAIGSVKYTFMEGLSLKAQGSYRTNSDDENEFQKDIHYSPSKYHGPNRMYLKSWFNTMLTGDIIADFNRSFGKHNIAAIAGFHAEKFDSKDMEMFRKDFPNNDFSDINAGSTSGMENKGSTGHLNMLSYFGRVTYDYAGKYLLEGNVRSDASSRFADGHRWGTFPSFSAGWRISEEDFMESARDIISNLKIRGSWGKLGNQNGLGYYPSVSSVSFGKDYSYPFNGAIVPGAAIGAINKRTISWEKTTTWGVGVDFGLFNTINGSIEYYDRRTTDILMAVGAPATFGLKGYTDNIGEMSNKGVEISLSYNKRFGEVDFGATANFSHNTNKILSLGAETMLSDGDYRKMRLVGHPYGSYYGYKTAGIFKSQEEIDTWPKYKMSGYKVMPGDLKYVDIDGDGEITAKDRVPLGATTPDMVFGFNLTAAYKGFDIQTFFQGAAGVSGYIDQNAIGEFQGDSGSPLAFWKDRWTPDNPNAKIPRIQNETGISSPNRIISDYWVQNANYLRLKNLQVGYTFPSNWVNKLSISRLRLFYSGENLLTFTSFLDGFDPETPSGGVGYPQVKVHSFGLSVTF